MAIGHGEECLGPVGAQPDHDQLTQAILGAVGGGQAHVEAHTVGPPVELLRLGRITGWPPCKKLGPPALGEPLCRRGRQARAGAEEALQRWGKIAGAHAAHVQDRQHFRDLGRLAHFRGNIAEVECCPARRSSTHSPLTSRRSAAIISRRRG